MITSVRTYKVSPEMILYENKSASVVVFFNGGKHLVAIIVILQFLHEALLLIYVIIRMLSPHLSLWSFLNSAYNGATSG